MRLLSTILLLAGLFILTSVQPTAQTVAPTFTSCVNGGLVWVDKVGLGGSQPSFHCVDPSTVGKTAATFVGVPCAAPGAGTVVMAQLPDGKSCLNLIAVPNAILAQGAVWSGYDQLVLVHMGAGQVVDAMPLAH